MNVLNFNDPTVNVKNVKVNQMPRHPVLSQNYPNPFNVSTVFRYQLPTDSFVELTIFSSTGQKISTLVSEQKQAGTHRVEWDAGTMASGVYFSRITVSDSKDEGKSFVQTRKLILLK